LVNLSNIIYKKTITKKNDNRDALPISIARIKDDENSKGIVDLILSFLTMILNIHNFIFIYNNFIYNFYLRRWKNE